MTTRPTTGNTLAWAVACERDQWGRAIAGNDSSFWSIILVRCLSNRFLLPESNCRIAGHVNVAPRHLTAEAETLLSATLIHEVSRYPLYNKLSILEAFNNVSDKFGVHRLFTFLDLTLTLSHILEMREKGDVLRSLDK